MKTSRPRHKIPPDKIDLFVELITLVLLLITFSLPILYYSKLPDEIPIHFNLKGIADGFADKHFIFLLPLLTAGQFLLLKYLNKNPHKYNYPRPITEENAIDQYTAATKMIRMLNLFCTALFSYLTVHIIRSSIRNTEGLGPYFIFVVVFGILVLSAYYYRRVSESS